MRQAFCFASRCSHNKRIIIKACAIKKHPRRTRQFNECGGTRRFHASAHAENDIAVSQFAEQVHLCSPNVQGICWKVCYAWWNLGQTNPCVLEWVKSCP